MAKCTFSNGKTPPSIRMRKFHSLIKNMNLFYIKVVKDMQLTLSEISLVYLVFKAFWLQYFRVLCWKLVHCGVRAKHHLLPVMRHSECAHE